MDPTHRDRTLRITHITVVGESLAVGVDERRDWALKPGRPGRRLAALLPVLLALAALPLASTPRSRALLAGGLARLLRAAWSSPAVRRRPFALPPGPR
jgi:hypothetical protein